MKRKKVFIGGVLVVIGALSIFLNSAFAQELFAPKNVSYDELEEGDIIPFDSELSIDAFFPSKGYLEGYDMGIFDSMHILEIEGSINVYWCKDETCLEDGTYDAQKEVLTIQELDGGRLTYDGHAKVNVSNYQDVFQESEEQYIGWKVHFIDSGILRVEFVWGGSGFMGEVKPLGNYQNIVLTPVTRDYVDCINNDGVTVEYYVEKVVDITDSPWYKENVINDYEALSDLANLTSWDEPASFSFEANKGDKLVLRLKTSTPSLKITLDGQEQPLPEMFYHEEELSCDHINPNRYYDYELMIPTDGKHTLKIEYLKNDEFSFPYIYLEGLKILKPIQAEEVSYDKRILEVKTCPNGYRVSAVSGSEPTETTPETSDRALQYGILLGISGIIIFIGLVMRRRVNE